MFLISLREWPLQMRLSTVTNTVYKSKVKELSDYYSPFEATPEEWEGCAGSEPHFRGYPCSLWSLFHTLSVASDEIDGGKVVASAMIGYVSNFFSCRECASHFSSHVSKLGYLPNSRDQGIMWLWSLHNMANNMLAGDNTEDPEKPKIQWPSPQNCPSWLCLDKPR